MYADVSVVVDGALEEDTRWYDELLLDSYVREVEEDAKGHGYLTEVYVVEHDHDLQDDCACVQYLTDHKPRFTFNGPVV